MAAARTESDDAFDALRRLSARLGRDIERTQGAGGNTSLKSGGTMRIKASGTWLAHAETRDIFVPVAIAPLLDALHAGDPRAEKATDFVVAGEGPEGLRPSIETAVHAVLPQPVVAHFHCVRTLAHAVRADGEASVAAAFARAGLGERHAYVPYLRPGVPLAHAMARAASNGETVIVLGNHGLVVAGDTVAEVEARIERVLGALNEPRRETAEADLAGLRALAAGTPYRLPADAASHGVALDPAALVAARGGSLYPDHVIFLGTAPAVLEEGERLADLLARTDAEGVPAPKLVLVPRRGVLVAEGLSEGGEGLVRCLAEVALRIEPGAALRYLDERQEYELTHWEAETYRQALDRGAAAGGAST